MATEGMREHVLSGVTSGRVLGRTVGACEEDTNRGSLLPLLSGPARSFRSKWSYQDSMGKRVHKLRGFHCVLEAMQISPGNEFYMTTSLQPFYKELNTVAILWTFSYEFPQRLSEKTGLCLLWRGVNSYPCVSVSDRLTCSNTMNLGLFEVKPSIWWWIFSKGYNTCSSRGLYFKGWGTVGNLHNSSLMPWLQGGWWIKWSDFYKISPKFLLRCVLQHRFIESKKKLSF